MESLIAWGIVVVILALVVHQIWKDRKAFPAFVALKDSASRRAYFRKSLFAGILKFSVLGLIGLFLLGQLDAILVFPDILRTPLLSLVGSWGISETGLYWIGLGVVGVFLLAMVVLTILPMFMSLEDLPEDGVFAMLPRNRKEMAWTAALSVNAGIGEEILFRVLLPIAVVVATGSLPLAIVAGVLLFGIAHGYQGVAGVISTSMIGLVFMVIYLATGALWLVMLLHVLTDIRGLVILPIILKWSERFNPDGSPIVDAPQSE
ncbi:MAG: hypothetical protein CMK09_06260 [Ponticaulis sp.]|nr:hypothetical protein [Ponticaulis sp.]|tara:strand:- start:5921 stop:6706 length:786 start_codon:yes stop_codon:yes gene_type:complete